MLFELKYRMPIFLLAILLGITGAALAQDRSSSYPYIAGDTFRAYCDFIYDETQKSFSPSDVQSGNTLFVKTDLLDEFFNNVHPKIQCPYILVTHNSDHPCPGIYGDYLDDNKIIAWFGQNVENFSHQKLHPVPIGIANKMWAHGNTDTWDRIKPMAPGFQRLALAYLNINVSTKPDERSYVYNLFSPQQWCYVSPPKKYSAYLYDLGHAKFVFSPRGNGLDCHRTWEALMMGAIPILRTSASDSMYDDLPVLIIQDWNIISKDYLESVYKDMKLGTYNLDKLTADYWFKLIDSYK